MSDNNNISWQQLLAKHGPWAFGCAVMGFVIYTFVLTPSALERKAFIETSIQNATSMSTVADSTKDVANSAEIISSSIERQEATQAGMKDELEKQTELRGVAMDTMSAFAQEMREVNPGNSLKLDVLLKAAEADDAGVKLDIIIEKIEAMEPAPFPNPQEP